MDEYKKVFATNLQNNLKRNIKGKVFVSVVKYDGVYVQITAEDGVVFKTHIQKLSDKLLNGYSINYAVYEITSQYREYIKKIVDERYFYND